MKKLAQEIYELLAQENRKMFGRAIAYRLHSNEETIRNAIAYWRRNLAKNYDFWIAADKSGYFLTKDSNNILKYKNKVKTRFNGLKRELRNLERF